MKEFAFIVTGGAAAVQVFKFHQMPQIGQTETALNTDADALYFGGCSFNIFYALAKLGCRAFPLLSYEHPRLEEKLYAVCREYDIPTDGLYGPRGESYYGCLMFQDDNRNHITVSYRFGKDAGKPDCGAKMQFRDADFARCGAVLMVMGTPGTGFQIVDMAKKHSLPLIYSYRNDPVLVPANLLRYVLDNVSILFTNEVEAAYIEKTFGLRHITDLMHTAKADIIVTTLGKRGSIVYSKNADGTVADIVVPVTENELGNVDAIGAGDGFVAGFLYGYAQGKSLRICAQYGSTVSSFVIEKDGSTTNLPTLEQMLVRNRARDDASDA